MRLSDLSFTFTHRVTRSAHGPLSIPPNGTGYQSAGIDWPNHRRIRQETLSRMQLIDQISEGDPTRRKLAEQLFNAPRNFEEGANEHTKKLASST